MPNVVVYNEASEYDVPIDESDSFTVVTLKTGTIKKRMAEIKQNHRRGVYVSDDAIDFYNNMNELITRQNIDPNWLIHHEDVATHRSFFKEPLKFFNYLTTNLGMAVELYTRSYGEVPERSDNPDHAAFGIHDENVEKIDNTYVTFPENIKPANKKRMIDMVHTLNDVLSSKSMNHLFNSTDIKFTKLKGGIIGQYFISSKDIRIQPLVKNSKSVILTLIHEYGHKLWHEFMDETTKQAIIDKFNEVSNEHEYTSTSDISSRTQEAISELKLKQTVHYTGRKSSLRKSSPYIIDEINGNQMKLVPDNERFSGFITAPTGIIMNKDWRAEGIDTTYQATDDYRDTEDWFPTKYSTTDHEEWFSEIFSYYVNNMLGGEPSKWLKEIL